jgi:GAF domain-containing protein
MFTTIRTFFTAPLYEGDSEKSQDARTTHRVAIALLGLAAFSILFILRLTSPVREYALYGTIGGAMVWLFTIGLIKRGRITGAKIIILAINTFNLIAITFITGGFSRPTITTTLFLLALANLLFPRKGAINYGAVILGLSIIIFLLGRVGLTPEPIFPGDDFSMFYIFSFTLVAAATVLAIASANSRHNLEHIRESQTELHNRNKELNELTEQLEARVEERTAELEQSGNQLQKRAAQFETIAQLARTINSIQEPELLLHKITQLVSVSFGFYHVGLFLLDESRQYAVLNAANSEGGRSMLDRNHKLKVGTEGIVGYVTSTGNPRIALDTGADAVFFDNPDLPETHSEMALPLKVGETVVGALDVQSKEPNAFTEDDVEVLAILADVVSVAIENARLFEESQRVLAEAQSAISESTQKAWQQLSRERETVGYVLSGTSVQLLKDPLKSDETRKAIKTGQAAIDSNNTRDKASVLVVPIKLRNQVIGIVNAKLPEGQEWDSDDVDITQTLADRVGVAIENATLLEESRRRAVKEQQISDITAKIGASVNMRNVLQTAVEELGQSIPGSEIVIQFNNNQNTTQEEQG